MIYAGPIQNHQYAQYANRTAVHKPDYAGITKVSYVPNDRVYKEVEKRQEIQTAAEKKVNETKRKRSLYKRLKEEGIGRYINHYA
ncbi:hypothetical protein P8907_08320 [Bacillus atrophaeus]|jgi:hypothetical protein|uniref:hypothetical protein n=1 Tax=Bacillus atrophaeus TaxID=1452 RepID=UPI00032FC30E|nr:hypothetical protein [Bacillus atrophaeus]AKL83930.1 hypothetical protein D068_cds12040 [Bacillus atrophaeus UCMB-5137]ASS70678.1 hypothetical protein BaGK_06755 [Bacillus atrophaeus]MBJ7895931.1 hypothetical protein [Bacillus atrophaeus]MCG8395731.1 hypothetical protein [Bacillus atrophaeus]MCY8466022.1 hypothetical protein [Bacillus atrophaeus]